MTAEEITIKRIHWLRYVRLRDLGDYTPPSFPKDIAEKALNFRAITIKQYEIDNPEFAELYKEVKK